MQIDRFEKNDSIVIYDEINGLNKGKVIDVQDDKVYIQWYNSNKVTIEKVTPLYKDFHDDEDEEVEKRRMEKISKQIQSQPSAKIKAIKKVKFNF